MAPDDGEEIKATIIAESGRFLASIISEDRLRKEILHGLESIVGAALGIPSPDTFYQLGPVTNDGKRYTTEQILEMSFGKFLELHRPLHTKDYRFTKTMNALWRGYHALEKTPPSKETPMRKLIELDPGQIYQFRHIGKPSVDFLVQYFNKNYGISLGTKYTPNLAPGA